MKNTQKIAIPSQVPGGLKAQNTTRFGRCPLFTIIDLNNGEIEKVEIITNGGSKAMGGAGSYAAQLISDHGVSTVVGGHYGPNAANALMKAGIAMYGPSDGIIQGIIQDFLQDKVPQVTEASSKSHTGLGRHSRNR